ncbi:MAG: ElyC/SanA/YdcF family protein [Filomicrobium sp.]
MSDCKRVVLVLANLMTADGCLNAESAARVELATRIFTGGLHDYLFLIGWDYRPDSSLAIADAMKNHLEAKAELRQERILINRLSRDSVGDAIFSRRDLDRLFTDYRLTVVSSGYHVRRLEHIFSRVYGPEKDIDYFAAETETTDKVLQSEQSSLQAFDNTFASVASGDLDGFLERLICAHPYYNGEVYPLLALDEPL